MNGKGSQYRPVNQKLWDESYERIFGRRTNQSLHSEGVGHTRQTGEPHAPAPNDKTETPKPAVEQAAHSGDSHGEDLHRRDMGQHWGREEDIDLCSQWHGENHASSDGTESGIPRL